MPLFLLVWAIAGSAHGAMAPKPQLEELLAAACQADLVKTTSVKMPLRCPRCPSDSGFAADKSGFFARRAFFGRFSKPREQALLVVEGCEPMANEAGGSYLLTHSTGGWHRESYFPGFTPEKCLKLRMADGVQALACLDDHSKQNLDYYFLRLSRLVSGELVQSEIINTGDDVLIGAGKLDAEAACLQPRLENLRADPRNPARFYVTLTMIHGTIKVGEGLGCFASEKDGRETRRVELTYDFDGAEARPDARTVRALEGVKAEVEAFRAANLKAPSADEGD
jgi:hypothetical protein